MSDLTKKVSYLKGYADGLDISPKSEEGKLIMKMLEVMEAMAEEIKELELRSDELDEVIADIDDELDEIAEVIYDDEYDEDEDPDWDEDDDDDWLDDDESDLFEIQCPNCGEDVMVDFDMLDDGNDIVCPNCHEEIELELDFDEDDQDK